jgi:hypothetical protein
VKIIIIELPKVPKEDDSRPLWSWTSLLKVESEEDIKMLVKNKPELKPAGDVIIKMSASERERALYEAREKKRMDERVRLREAREDGIFLGEQNILNLLAAGTTPEEILKKYSKN